MPILKSPRHERYAQELAKGTSATEAYDLAGYRGDRTAASRLSTKANIASRVSEILSHAAEATQVTIESIARQLDEDRALARQKGQAGAAVAATMGKAKLYGMLRERLEHSGKDGGAIQLRDQNPSPRDTAKALLIALSGPSNEAEANDT